MPSAEPGVRMRALRYYVPGPIQTRAKLNPLGYFRLLAETGPSSLQPSASLVHVPPSTRAPIMPHRDIARPRLLRAAAPSALQRAALALIAATLLFGALPAAAQTGAGDVSVSVQIAPVESFRLSDFSLLDPSSAPLFVTVFLSDDREPGSQSGPRKLRLEVDIRAERFGLLGVGDFDLGPVEPLATRIITNRDFASIDATAAGEDVLEFLLAQPALPADTYTFTARVFEGDRLVGEGSDGITTAFDIDPPEPLTPGVPFGEAVADVPDPLPLFQWQSEGEQFELRVYLVEPGRVSAEDAVGALPVFERTGLSRTFLSYPASAEPLRRDSTYAWQVTRILQTPEGPQELPGPVHWFRHAPPAEPLPRIARVAVEPTELTVASDGFALFEAEFFDDTDQPLGFGQPTPTVRWSVSPATAGEVDDTGRFQPSGRDMVAAITATVFTPDGELSDFGTAIINLPAPEPEAEEEAKLSAALHEALLDARMGGFESDSVLILATFTGDMLDAEQTEAVRRAGAVVDLVEAPWVQLMVPFARLVEVAQLSFLNTLSTPAPPVTQAVSLGTWGGGGLADNPDAHAEPDAAYHAEPSPKGGQAEVGVAVVEFGFDLAAARESLGGTFASARSFRRDRSFVPNASLAAHGRASVESLAGALPPEARVHLLAVQTEPELLRAFRYAVDTLGVRVISCSVAWLDAYDHYDGSSTFSQRLDAIAGDDVAVVVAAGNFAESHWEGPYTDENGDGRHDFRSRDGDLRLRLRSGVSYSILLSWDDWDAPGSDLDLALAGEDGALLYRAPGRAYRSANRQAVPGETSANRFGEPTERIEQIAPPLPGVQTYRLQVSGHALAEGASPHFEVYIYPPPEGASPPPMPESSLASGIATARRIIPVAARDVAASSHGPTNDARLRPDFSASGIVRVAGQSREGTSFAAPRVAAAFASVFAQHPDWQVEQATDLMRRACDAEAGAEKSSRYGWGVLNSERLAALLGPR